MVKKFDRTPMLMKITSPRKARHATELLEKLFADAGIENKNLAVETEEIPVRSKAELFHANLIRKEHSGFTPKSK